jgi:outer membrane protein assembly factor BamB
LEATPAVSKEGLLFFSAHDKALHGVSRENAAPAFQVPLDSLCLHKPLLFGESEKAGVLLALQGGKIVFHPLADPEKGEVLLDAGKPFIGGPAEFQGILVVGDQMGRLIAFDLVARKSKWESQLGSPAVGAPLIREGIVYVGTQRGKVFAMDLAEGTVLPGWPFDTQTPFSTGPIVHGDLLLTATKDGHLIGLNRTKGAFAWKARVGGVILARPCASGNTVYLGAADGALYALDITNRDVLWKFETGGPVRSAPILSQGMVLFGSADGFFYAVRE